MLRLACLAFAAIALSAHAQQTPGVTARSIVIGQSAPLTGSNAELGNDIRNGALAYLQKVNDAGGVHGRRVELVSLDDGNVVARADANTKKLVEEQAVFALFGYASATLSRPALPYVEKHRVPFLGPFTGADPMRVFNKHVYNMRGSYAEELEKIVDHFVPLGVKRFSIVYYDDVIGRENLTAVDRALKARGLTAVSTAAFKDRAIAVVLSGTGSDGAMGVRAIKKMGGTVIVQDQRTSLFYGMPDAAVHTGSVDFVLPVDEIPPALVTLVASREAT